MERYLFHLPIALVAYAGTAIGQSAQPPVLPSSDAMNTIKNISTPVNYYTGTAGVTIPLMQLSGKELTVPVTLSYNCSGHKVQEIAGSTGLGWSLSAGGMVTRVIRGKPDEEAYFGSTGDEEAPDLFFYSFCGQGGKFFLDKYRGAHTMPFRNLKISFTQTGGNITAFEISDENGVTYLFGGDNKIEQTGVTPAADSKIKDKTTKTHNSSWVLTKINNANSTESIDFTYVESSYSTESKYLMSTVSGVCPPEIQNYSNITQIKQRLVSSITSSLGKIEFTYSDNRKDLESSTKYLSQIKLSNAGGQRIQTIRLSYSYFSTGCTEKECYRLRLDKIYDRQMAPICTFSYNTENNLPSRNSEACDYWGYFNNMNMATSFFPSFPKDMIIECSNFSSSQTTTCKENTPYRVIDGGDRRVSANHTQANILNRIEYRGGAYKAFEYEAHLANLYKGNNREVDSANITYGGARIRSITAFDGAITQKQVLEYVNEDSTTSGAIYTIPKFGILTLGSASARYLTSYPLHELTDYNNVGVGYSRVVETIMNADSIPGRKTIYNYSNFDLYNDQMSGGYRVDNSMKRGQLLSSAVFDSGGNKIKEEVYTYNFDVPIITSLGWKEITSVSATCNDDKNHTSFSVTRQFKFIEKPVQLTTQLATTYRNGLSQSIQTNYEYNNLGQVSSTTQWHTNNATEKYKTETTWLDQVIEASDKSAAKLPTDECEDRFTICKRQCANGEPANEGQCFTQCENEKYKCVDSKENRYRDIPGALVTLAGRNQVNVPIETVSSLIKDDNKTVLSAQFNLFEKEGQKVYLKESYAMNEPVTNYQGVTVTVSAYQKDSRLRLQSTNNSIDDKGNITQQTDKYGISTAYTYDTLSVPTQTTVTSNADTRTSTMTYIPLVGTTSKTDANSLSSYTDYDALGRVKFTKDQNQDIVKRNQYHTAGESIGFEISGNTSGCVSNSFTFEASHIAYTRGNPPTFLWEFGDGKSTQTTAASVTHTWTTAGTYNLRVTAFNDVYEPTVQNKSVEVFFSPSFNLRETDNGSCEYTITSDYNGPTATYSWKTKSWTYGGELNPTGPDGAPLPTSTEWADMLSTSSSLELSTGREISKEVQLTIHNSCGTSSSSIFLPSCSN